VHFTVPFNLMRPAQWLIGARALAVGPENSSYICIGQDDFENDCSVPPGCLHPESLVSEILGW
jgi:hypothetical protein